MKTGSEFKHCQHCGDLFFAEDIDKKGVCKLCRDGHNRFTRYEISNTDD